MTKKWIGINLLLLVIAAFAVWQLRASWQQYAKNNDLSNIQPPSSLSQKTAQETILPAPLAERNYNPQDFTVIPEKNVFSETRTNQDTGDSTAATGNMPDSQKPVLVGVIETEHQKVASIREPARRGAAGEVQMKQVGDTYEGYTVTEIERDHIVLDNGREKEMIYLNDPDQPVQRVRARVMSTRVIPIGSGTSAANTQTYVVYDRSTGTNRTVQMPASRNTAAGPNTGANDAQSNVVVVAPAGQTGAGQPAATGQPAGNVTQSSTQQVPASNPGGTQRRTRVIPSPFGDIIRNPQGQ